MLINSVAELGPDSSAIQINSSTGAGLRIEEEH